jgi:hypothetical protein
MHNGTYCLATKRTRIQYKHHNEVEMLHDIPGYLSLHLAAKLTALSPRAFRRTFLETRRVKYHPDDLWHDGTGRNYIRRWELEKALGRKFTLPEIQAADAKLEPRRRYQRLYRRGFRNPRTYNHPWGIA